VPLARSSTKLGPDEIALAPRARLEVLIIVAASLVGIVARLFPSSPLWLDEALTVNIAHEPVGSITDALRHDGHPPLYYYVLHGWMGIFGTSDFAVRSLSMAFGFIALGLTFVIARRHGGRELAAMSAFVMAVSPYGVRYSSETRMYAMVIVLVLIGWLVLDAAIANPTVLRLLPLAILSGALMLTHYWCIFLITGLVWLLGVHAWFVPGERKSHMRAAIAIVAGGLLFIPWLGGFWYQTRHTGTPWASTARPTRVVSESLVDFSGGLDPEAILLLLVTSFLLVVGVFGHRDRNQLVLGRSAEPWVSNAFAVLAATIVVGAGATFVTQSAFAGRYAAVFFPIFVVLVGLGLAHLGHNWVRTGAVALIALFSLAGVFVEIHSRDRTQAGQIAAAINEGAAAGDVVVICPDQLGPALERRLRPDLVALAYPDLSSPRFIDWVDYEDRVRDVDPAAVARAIAARAPANGRIWVEFSSSYRVVEEQCDRLIDALAQLRPNSAQLIAPDGGRYFESAALRRFDPAV
jgi:4-amino-4-deoxy-L-arabinose transferase-like glycosyltransferase